MSAKKTEQDFTNDKIDRLYRKVDKLEEKVEHMDKNIVKINTTLTHYQSSKKQGATVNQILIIVGSAFFINLMPAVFKFLGQAFSQVN